MDNSSNRIRPAQLFFLLLLLIFIVFPFVSRDFCRYAPGLAVISGAIFAVAVGNPFAVRTAKLTHPLLSWSIIGMGFGMNLISVLQAGVNGIFYTMVGIVMAITLGIFIGKKIGLPRDTTFLTSIGTAICGGSAIAAAAPVLQAKSHDIAVSMATVFILNAIALLIFPVIGHHFGLSETQFGFWSALAIHDTSSVVGASFQYGPAALEVGTTVKLARALWIVPLTLALAYYIRRHNPGEKPALKAKFPWFIPGFLAAAALVTWVPSLEPGGALVKTLAQHLMIVTLFLIGSNLNREKLRSLGAKPLIHGCILWVVVSSVWLIAVKLGMGMK